MSTVRSEVMIATPISVYWAAVGTAFPAIDATPGGSWNLVGTNGNLNYDEDEAVTVMMDQTINEWRALGDSGTAKVWRPSESFKTSLALADLSLEQFRHAMNLNAVTDVAAGSGTAGYRKIGLSRGLSVATMALLIRGKSPYDDELFNMQFELPIVFNTGSQEVKLGGKDGPSLLKLEWTSIIDPSASSALERFGRLVAQDAAAA